MKRLGFLLFILLILYFIFLIRQDIIDHLSLSREATGLELATKRELILAEQLKQRLSDLNGSEYIERLAREKLGFIKNNETAYKVIGR